MSARKNSPFLTIGAHHQPAAQFVRHEQAPEAVFAVAGIAIAMLALRGKRQHREERAE